MSVDLKKIEFIDSVIHRIRISRKRKFKLRDGNDFFELNVSLQNADTSDCDSTSIKIINGRGQMSIPVRKGKLSALSSPVKLRTKNGKKLLLNARVKPTRLFGSYNNVCLTLYSENGTDLHK